MTQGFGNRLLEALMGRPAQVVSMPETVTQSDYYEPLGEQVDYMNTRRNYLPEYDRNMWDKIGYETIKNNALQGKNSGLPSIQNAMNNMGLEPNQDTQIVNSGLTTIPAKSGFFTDLASGYKENLNTPLKVDNLRGSQDKGIANRIGEGLGTFVRTLDKPIGRAALSYGLTKALGGGNDISAINALSAGVTNQQLRTQDEIYRKGLQEQGLDTSNIRGYVTDDLYKNYSNSYYKLRDLQRRELTAEAYNQLTRLRAQEQAIKNSTLPQLEKAKLIQENAKAQYAVEMQLAKIDAYKNSSALGWGRLGIQQENLDIRKQEQAAKNAERQAKIQALEDLTGGGSNIPNKVGGRAF